jgi:putative phage-type endonuclease
MREVFGKQQGDNWIRSRVGRITGSRISDVIARLKNGQESAKRRNYRLELIAERLTGRAADHFVSPAMDWGSAKEDDAVLFYEGALKVIAEPIGFVLHPKHDFTGASPDRSVADDGLLEVKCPTTETHLEWVIAGQVPEEHIPQMQWEMACTGRKWCDFVSYDPRIQDSKLRFFYRRVERDDAKIEELTAEVLKLNAEIEYFMAQHECKPIGPYPVELVKDQPQDSVADEAFITKEDLDRYLPI